MRFSPTYNDISGKALTKWEYQHIKVTHSIATIWYYIALERKTYVCFIIFSVLCFLRSILSLIKISFMAKNCDWASNKDRRGRDQVPKEWRKRKLVWNERKLQKKKEQQCQAKKIGKQWKWKIWTKRFKSPKGWFCWICLSFSIWTRVSLTCIGKP